MYLYYLLADYSSSIFQVFELLAGTPLFGMRIIKDEQIVDSETVHIGLMLAYTGQTFPQKMFELAERSKVFLNNPGRTYANSRILL